MFASAFFLHVKPVTVRKTVEVAGDDLMTPGGCPQGGRDCGHHPPGTIHMGSFVTTDPSRTISVGIPCGADFDHHTITLGTWILPEHGIENHLNISPCSLCSIGFYSRSQEIPCAEFLVYHPTTTTYSSWHDDCHWCAQSQSYDHWLSPWCDQELYTRDPL